MSVEFDIQAAFLSRLITSANGVPPTSNITNPVTPVAVPFMTYTPVSGKAYVEARPILRAEPDHPGLRPADSTFRRGIFQVDAVVPDGGSEAPGIRLAELVAARFPIGTEMAAGGRRLQLDKEPIIASAIKDGSWVRYPVSIRYLIIT